MAEIRPIINPVQVKDRMGSPQKQAQGDPFSITGDVIKEIPAVKQDTEGKAGAENQKNALYAELSRQILKPIREKTDIQASELRELLTAAKILNVAGEKIPQEMLDKLFINPGELLKALVQKDKGETSFNGEVFDILRMLANLKVGKGAQNVQNPILSANQNSGQPINASELLNNQSIAKELSPEARLQELLQLGDEENTFKAGGVTIEDTSQKALNINGTVSSEAKVMQLKNAVVNVLRHFDCYVNQENSLKAILAQLTEVQSRVSNQDRGVLAQYIGKLETLIKEGSGADSAKGLNSSPFVELQNQLKSNDILQMDSLKINETQRFLKDQLIPLLSKVVNKYQQAPAIREPVAAIIHYVARYDKASPDKMNIAMDDLRQLVTENMNISDKDAAELKNLLFESARNIRQDQRLVAMEKEFLASYGVSREEGDMLSLISKNLGDEQPARLQKLAFNLLNTMVDSQSPVMPMMHYMIPVKWGAFDTFLEMYVKKGKDESQGGANSKGGSSEVNIFFTIQSDNHGTFEVDLLAKNKFIDLDIKAPADIQKEVKAIRGKINEGLGELGYKLAGYKVGVYKTSKNAGDKFPELKHQKIGIDIKI